jgi:hypothetical protein
MESHAKARDFEEFQTKFIPHHNKLYVILLAFVEIKNYKKIKPVIHPIYS